MDNLAILNSEQKRAVLEGDGAALVVAGPGSGKTRTIVHRLCHQISKGVPPERILLLTFTNKASAEMKRRAIALGGDAASRICSGTFHHFANLILRRHASSAGLSPRFSILDEEDSITLLSRAAKRRFPDSKRSLASNLLRAVSLSKLRMQPLSEIIMNDPDFFQLSRHIEEAEAVARDYEEEKKAADSLDFDDLLLHAKLLLEANPHILSHYQALFSDILVDEFQDTDRLQMEILSQLYPPGACKGEKPRNLMAVGDDSQSIYSFRGADIRNMLEFQSRYDAKTFFLSTNYRSTDQIVKLVNRCMDGSKARIEKTLVSAGKGGLLPRLMEAANPSEEAYAIAHAAEEELLSGSTVGVLFRSAYLASELELELNRRGIAYELRGGRKFAEQAHIKDMLAVLRVHENPKDRAAASRLLRLLPGIGEKKAEGILEKTGSGAPLAATIGSLNSKKLVMVTSLLSGILAIGESGNAASILDRFYTGFYRGYMESAFDDAAERKPDIDALIGAAAKSPDVRSFLDSFSLSPDQKPGHSDAQSRPSLILSTIHQAKGLEWDTVFVMGLAEGLLPHAKSTDIEEERRLFYVAVSRAKSRLFMSYPLQSARFYDVAGLERSRFVSGLPDNCYAVE